MAHRPFHLMVYRGKIALEEQSADFMLLWNLNEPVQVCSDNETFEMKKDDLLSLNPYENCTVQAENGRCTAEGLFWWKKLLHPVQLGACCQ